MLTRQGYRWKPGQPWKGLAWYALICIAAPLAFRALFIDHPVLTESEMFYLAIVATAVPLLLVTALSDVARGFLRKSLNAAFGLFTYLYGSFFVNWALNEAGITDQVVGGFVFIVIGLGVYIYLAAGSGLLIAPAEGREQRPGPS